MGTITPLSATVRSRAGTLLCSALGCVALVLPVAGHVAPAAAAPAAPLGTAAPAATAQAAPAGAPAAPDLTVATISPDLALVSVDGLAFRAARSALQSAQADLDANRAARADAEAQLTVLTAREADLSARLAQDTAARKQAGAQLTRVHDALRAIAVTSYVEGTGPVPDALDVEAATAAASERVVFEAVSSGQHDKEQVAAEQLARADAALNADLGARTEARLQRETVSAARDAAATNEVALVAQVAQLQAALEQARARADVVNADGMSLIALDAYWKAAQEAEQSRPRCGITWWALAGIGRVEGHHGTFGTSHLLGSGDTSAPIVGIVLDGTNDTAVIPDTDHGEFDGDPAYDHAVGPMQFIPSTWAKWKGDGNGDGKADPNNMYDAAVGAAHYLCASGPMRTEDDLTRGYFSYNHSDDYAAAVLGDAVYYRDNVRIPTPPPGQVVPTAATPAVPSGG